ncbi:MAG TPA: iron-sulfur cluster assembly protein, partial [Gemmatimonadales bacterium]|nr:iron-sulfur cluster assembly protein [Gemmatimonadales bacterium]
MSAPARKTDIEQTLGGITSPRHGSDLMSAGMVRDITVDAAGVVTFTFVLTREDPGSLARQARKAVEGVAGVTAVKMNVVDSADGG